MGNPDISGERFFIAGIIADYRKICNLVTTLKGMSKLSMKSAYDVYDDSAVLGDRLADNSDKFDELARTVGYVRKMIETVWRLKPDVDEIIFKSDHQRQIIKRHAAEKYTTLKLYRKKYAFRINPDDWETVVRRITQGLYNDASLLLEEFDNLINETER